MLALRVKNRRYFYPKGFTPFGRHKFLYQKLNKGKHRFPSY